MELATISPIELFETGLKKSDIKQLANSAVESVLDNGNILPVSEAISAMIEFGETVKKDKRFVENVRDEVSKYGKEYKSTSGAKIECCEVGTKYDYSKCNDPELVKLEMDLFDLEEKIKKRKEYLKNLPIEGVETLFFDEVIRLYPPSKTSTSSFKITLAK